MRLIGKINTTQLIILQKFDNKEDKNRGSQRDLSGTFADLPAPELEWEQMPSATVPRLDGFAIQIKNLLYVFSGYGTLDYVRTVLYFSSNAN